MTRQYAHYILVSVPGPPRLKFEWAQTNGAFPFASVKRVCGKVGINSETSSKRPVRQCKKPEKDVTILYIYTVHTRITRPIMIDSRLSKLR